MHILSVFSGSTPSCLSWWHNEDTRVVQMKLWLGLITLVYDYQGCKIEAACLTLFFRTHFQRVCMSVIWQSSKYENKCNFFGLQAWIKVGKQTARAGLTNTTVSPRHSHKPQSTFVWTLTAFWVTRYFFFQNANRLKKWRAWPIIWTCRPGSKAVKTRGSDQRSISGERLKHTQHWCVLELCQRVLCAQRNGNNEYRDIPSHLKHWEENEEANYLLLADI